ncbi:MAG: Fic family protein [Acidimicrobiaceae bacterium]|nr:Fic family protein [Acidimicrobiaceae bacterium]
MDLFEVLGFNWDRTVIPDEVPIHSVERACFRLHRMLPEFVWDAGVLEGNPFTFAEVQTLLGGVTVGGHKFSDQEQILNLAESVRCLLRQVKSEHFKLDKVTLCELHEIVARNEALEWGHFRGEGQETNYAPDVGLGEHGRYTPLPTIAGAPELNRLFASGVNVLDEGDLRPFEKGLAFFLFGSLQQFFFDGNKRTSRFMMNGILMSNGIDAISVPASQAQSFNEKMVRFYLTKDATEMMNLLVGCHPDVTAKRSPEKRTGSTMPFGFSIRP